jgi:3-deoxy-manno-octulosonate cytidylyltransferase (CMP-KDO synthetase)
MKTIAVIPARLGSTRLPGKLLREIAGQPLISRVYRDVQSCELLEQVLIATDSREILELCAREGFHARLSSSACRNGTERVQEISKSIAADLYVNVQGDELLARAEHIVELLKLMEDAETQVGTLKTPASFEDVSNPNAVKVVTDMQGRALYFSRSTIPHDRDGTGAGYFKHMGFYAYRKAALDCYAAWRESALERSERLEQLRFLENGVSIRVGETSFDTIRVDTPEDLQRAESFLRVR